MKKPFKAKATAGTVPNKQSESSKNELSPAELDKISAGTGDLGPTQSITFDGKMGIKDHSV